MRKAIANTTATPTLAAVIIDVEEVKPACIKWRVWLGEAKLGEFGSPFFQGARACIERGENPKAPFAMRHKNTGVVGMRGTALGESARWETGGRPWRLVADRARRQEARDARAAEG